MTIVAWINITIKTIRYWHDLERSRKIVNFVTNPDKVRRSRPLYSPAFPVKLNTLKPFTFSGNRVKLRGFQGLLINGLRRPAGFFCFTRILSLMVTIRMSRGGAKKRPFYHIVVTDSRKRRDGGYIERIGFFNPVATGGEERLRLDADRADHWTAKGAQLSPRVEKLLKDSRAQ